MLDWSRKLRFRISTRIFLGFGAIIGILVLQSVVAHRGFDEVNNSLGQYGATNAETIAILEIERNALELQRIVLAFTYSGYSGMITRVHMLQNSLDGQLNQVDVLITDEKRKNILKRMREHFQSYKESFEAAVDEYQSREYYIHDQMSTLANDMSGMLSQALDWNLLQRYMAISAVTGDALQTFLLAHKDAQNFIHSPDSILEKSTKEKLISFRKKLVQLQEQPLDKESRSMLTQVTLMAPKYEEAFSGQVQATRTYMHLVYVVMAGQAAEIAHLAQDLKKFTLQERKKVESDFHDNVNFLRDFNAALSAAAVLMGLILAWWIIQNTSKPITQMTRSLTSLARGSKNVEIPSQERSDEIGAMAIAANVFKEKADELENASRYKSEFLANMSHELRTPLNSLLILAKMLSDNEEQNLTQDQVESALIIYESGKDLLSLINDILDLSKVEAGRMELVTEDGDLRLFCSRMERQFKHMAAARDLEFQTNIDGGVPQTLHTDWSKLEQIIRNLLSNAFKFTTEGGVYIDLHEPSRKTVFMDTELHSGNTIGIRIRDTGIGIPQDKKEQIFEAFRQVDGTTSRKYGGTGLGLSISRKFSQLMGGEIQVESKEGEGSSFTLYLPLELSTTRTNDTRSSVTTVSEAGGYSLDRVKEQLLNKNLTILVVDDDKRNIFAIQQILNPIHGNIKTAANGQKALELLSTCNNVDIVLMDIMMPVMSGYEAIEHIREVPKWENLPIIALTAKALKGDREKCMNAGASDYLPKPVDAVRLFQTMLELLDQKPQKTETLAAAPVQNDDQRNTFSEISIVKNGIDATGLETANFEPTPVTILVVDDDVRNIFSLASFLQKKAGKVLLAHDGSKALDQLEEEPDVSLVLLDIMMPRMDGYETLRRIRDDSRFKDLPVIALTAKTMQGDREKCIKAGADDYLAKPIELDILTNKIQEWLLKHENSKSI
ncbi:MAG: response regulator [SAR324 cluster bacterium]|nr:response regulator [SAR324 cluster bacterium]